MTKAEFLELLKKHKINENLVNMKIKEQLHHDLNHWHSIGSHWIMAIGEIRKFFRILSDGNILTKLKE